MAQLSLKNQVKYIQIITKDPKMRDKRNLIDNMKIFKICGLKERYVYIWHNSHTKIPRFFSSISDGWMKEMNQIQYKCIWKNKHHYIRNSDVVNEG